MKLRMNNYIPSKDSMYPIMTIPIYEDTSGGDSYDIRKRPGDINGNPLYGETCITARLSFPDKDKDKLELKQGETE